MNVPLRQLGLEREWPRLAKLQDEVADLERQVRSAEVKVSQLQADLQAARQKDVDLAAQALREGKKAPEPKYEPQVQANYEGAIRDRLVLQRALETANEDAARLLRQHQQELYDDAVAVRQKLANEAAEGARKALASFNEWYDARYILKRLAPVPPAPDANQPAQRLTQSIHGIQTTRSLEPDRGAIEGALQYLISLAANEEGGESAA